MPGFPHGAALATPCHLKTENWVSLARSPTALPGSSPTRGGEGRGYSRNLFNLVSRLLVPEHVSLGTEIHTQTPLFSQSHVRKC